MNRPSWKVMIFIVVLTWVLTTIGSFGLMWYQAKLDQDIQRVEAQRLAYYRLKGLKTPLLQVHLSVNRVQADSLYYFRLSELSSGIPAQRAMDAQEVAVEKEQELLLKRAEAHRELDETLGLIHILFPRTLELEEHINKIDSFGSIEVGPGRLG